MQTDQELASKVGKVMLHVVQPEPAATVSPYVEASASSERTEFEARFERVQRLAIVFRQANERCSTWFRENREKQIEFGSDEFYRNKVDEHRVIRAKLDAENAYHAACDTFFLNMDERG